MKYCIHVSMKQLGHSPPLNRPKWQFGKIDQIKWCNRKQKRIKVFARVLAHLEN